MVALAKGHEKISLALLTIIPILFFYSLKFHELIYFFIIVGFLLIWHIIFFRDPSRKVKIDSKSIIAPADGRIYEIIPKEGVIRIRMSLLDVHVNRWPVSGVITSITRKQGKNWPFFPFLRQGTDQNSRQIFEIRNNQGIFRIVQIVGFIARRCVSYHSEEDQITQGERLGMIHYGSEVDIYFPEDKYNILVKNNDRTTAGITVLAKLKE
jgi:phosphatidylserine decarboxylase